MKFGKVDHPEQIDFTLPVDHPDTEVVLRKLTKPKKPKIYVGCATWNRKDLKNFYPRGTKDELTYYATQFNSIEFNATFYRLFSKEQHRVWKAKVPQGFKFFPKVTNDISHYKRLINVTDRVDTYLDHTLMLGDNLGTIFLQLHNNFQPKNWDRVAAFVAHWPEGVPLAVEFRHADWFGTSAVASKLYHLLETYNVANTIVDTAGRRDLMHMRLTNGEAYVRFVGANHPVDYERLDAWLDRLVEWVAMGLQQISFFIHQNIEQESPLLAAYFIEKLNKRLACNLKIPGKGNGETLDLFA